MIRPLAAMAEVAEMWWDRAALKLDGMGNEADDSTETVVHFGKEGWKGSIAGPWLAAYPVSGLGLSGSAQQAQNRGGHGMADPTAVLAATDIESVMGSVLDGPVLAHQFEQSGRVGLLRRQTGDDPDRLHLLAAVAEFADAIDSCHLGDVRKANLPGVHVPHFDATPLDPSVALIDRQVFRGKRTPVGVGSPAS